MKIFGLWKAKLPVGLIKEKFWFIMHVSEKELIHRSVSSIWRKMIQEVINA